MASSKSLRDTVCDVTECPICTETMVDSRVLPCIHTFCFKCLDQLWKDKQPGVKVPCPLCRTEVALPIKVVSGLPRNHFVDKLVEAQKISESSDKAIVNCDICPKHSGHKAVSVSEMFCYECQQYLCKQCLQYHSSMNTTSKHQVFPAGSKFSTTAERLMHSMETCCELHEGEKLRIFCLDCKAAVCTICFITEHNGHRWSDIQKVADDLKKQIRSDIEDARKIVVEVDNESKHLENSLMDFNRSVEETQLRIVQAGEKLKQFLDKHVKNLLQKLRDEKSKKSKEFESVREELQVQRLSLESFIKFSETILEKAAPTDVANVAKGLSVQVGNLKHQKVPRILNSLLMLFSPNDSLISFAGEKAGNLIGKITARGNIVSRQGHVTFSYTKNPTRIASIRSTGCVRGMALLEDELFVIDKESPDVTVFDINTYEFKSKFTVPGLFSAYGMAASNKILLVSESASNIIHRIQLPENLITAWSSAGGKGNGLSINKQGNVLVTCQSSRKLFEYTDTGTLVRNIYLPYGVNDPLYSVQLDNKQFLVSHSKKIDRVCLVDDEAKLIKSFGVKFGPGSDQLNSPYQFVVDQNGFILVADFLNDRVVLLNAQLEFVKHLIPPSAGIQRIFAIALDEYTGKCYVSDGPNEHITVFQLHE